MESKELRNNIIGLIILGLIFGGIVWLVKGLNLGSRQEEQSTTSTVASDEDMKDTIKATIKTDRGDIMLVLYPKVAPKTVENFVAKAKSGYFNNLKFHRVEDWVIQGGDPLSRDDSKKQMWGTGGGNIATELSSKPFVKGALGVARGGDIKISNDSQFFIVKKDSQFLNNQYTLFGQVTQGMDIAQKIAIGNTIQAITIE